MFIVKYVIYKDNTIQLAYPFIEIKYIDKK